MQRKPVTTPQKTSATSLLDKKNRKTMGTAAHWNNIGAGMLLSEMLKSSIGPRGLDKMMIDPLGDVKVTNHAPTMFLDMDVVHPAAKMLVEAARAVDAETGDGSTSTIVFAGALLEEAQELLKLGIHPSIIVHGYRIAVNKAIEYLNDFAEPFEEPERESLMMRAARANLQTKLVPSQTKHIAELVVEATSHATESRGSSRLLDLDNILIEKKPGGSLADSTSVRGIILDKTVIRDDMPMRVENARIAVLHIPMEMERTKYAQRITITKPGMVSKYLDAQDGMLKAMAEKIISVGANVVVGRKGIDDMVAYYLAKAGVMAVRRLRIEYMSNLAKATGARMIHVLDDLSPNDLGFAGLIEQRKVEQEKWVFVEGCKDPRAMTILVRGGTQRVVDEAARSVRDALMVSKDLIEKPAIIWGGGATETELSCRLSRWSKSLRGKEHIVVQRFAKALETIPHTLAKNSGINPLDAMVELRSLHTRGNVWSGIDGWHGRVGNMREQDIIEPVSVKEQMLMSATEVACMIVRVDHIVGAKKSNTVAAPDIDKGPQMPLT